MTILAKIFFRATLKIGLKFGYLKFSYLLQLFTFDLTLFYFFLFVVVVYFILFIYLFFLGGGGGTFNGNDFHVCDRFHICNGLPTQFDHF